MHTVIIVVIASAFLSLITHLLDPTFFDSAWNLYKELLNDKGSTKDHDDFPPKDSW